MQAVFCLGAVGNLKAYGLQSLLLLVVWGNRLGSKRASVSVRSDLPRAWIPTLLTSLEYSLQNLGAFAALKKLASSWVARCPACAVKVGFS